MAESDQSFRVLLAHDGELAFVRDLLAELAVDFEERVGATSEEDREGPWNVVVANAARLRELAFADSAAASRIAIVTDDSRTLRAMLRRLGVTLMVRQPVHPAAFRLLMLHAMYRGPERRRASRASVGGQVRVRLGLRSRSAVLLDLSRTGCRVMLDTRPAPGKRVRIAIPFELGGGKKLTIKGITIRSEALGNEAGPYAVGVLFDSLGRRSAARLDSVLERHVSGPAVMQGGEVAGTVERPSPSTPEHEPGEPAEIGSASGSEPGSEPGALGAEKVEGERRGADRRAFEQRVIGLTQEAARVLLGRDLAVGGMRVGADAGLSVGERLWIAFPVPSRGVPLVVKARVIRDDGPEGLVLVFEDLSAADCSDVEKMVEALPVVCGEDEANEAGVVVSEIVDRKQAAGGGA